MTDPISQSNPVITIDGPSGTGKGTIAQLLAEELKWNLLDSGALYRVLALAAKQHRVETDKEEALTVLARHLDVQFKATSQGYPPRIILEGEDVTETIRSEECGSDASKIATIASVRTALLDRQRAFCEAPGLVTDGRDMGTVVFPQAILKIYLEASQEERAKRRYNQLKEKGINVTLDSIFDDLVERDKRDSKRLVAPLKPAKDAIIIDTTGMHIEQVLKRILHEVHQKIKLCCE